MQRYLYGYEVVLNKLMLKFVVIDENNPTVGKSETCGLKTFMEGAYTAENIKSNGNTITIGAATVNNAKDLMTAIDHIDKTAIRMSNGGFIKISGLGHIILVPPTAPVKEPAVNSEQKYVQAVLEDCKETEQGYDCLFRTLSGKKIVHFNNEEDMLTKLGKPYLEEKALLSLDCTRVELADIKTAGEKFIDYKKKVEQPKQNTSTQPVSVKPAENGEATSHKSEIDSLVEELNAACKAYYLENKEIMSNKEYDEKYDRLLELESTTGYIRPDSPTQNIGAGGKDVATNTNYKTLKQGDKVTHEEAALSQNKTKDVADLIKLLANGEGVLSTKMDGLTIVLTYDDGKLTLGATRGNGVVGDVITDNTLQMIGVPKTIPYTGHLVVRGEGYINYTDFDSINNAMSVDAEFKNPRNLASGTIRTFNNPKAVSDRHVRFCAFEVVNWSSINITKFSSQLVWLTTQGFNDIVKHKVVTAATIANDVVTFTNEIKASDIPADGLVLRLNDCVLGDRLGITGKFPRHSIAFKWLDTEVETELVGIDWTLGRSGIITPTAVFKPVTIEGSTIARASLHNVSMMKQILGRPYKGQKIWVYKANLIIPQVARAEKITAQP